MGWVLADATTIDGEVYERDSTPPPEIAARVGEHLRKYAPSGGSSVVEVVEPDPAPIQVEAADEGESTFSPEFEGPTEPVSTAAGDTDPPEETAAPEPEPGAEEPAQEAPVEIPPKGGPGSAKGAWAEYARAKGVSVEPGASRDDIIRDLEDAGIATE